jgi:hypothetical protein
MISNSARSFTKRDKLGRFDEIESLGENQMSDDPTVAKPRKWLNVLFSVLGVLVLPIVIAWYTISRTEQQAVLAESERARSVRASIVAIVEEHVVNGKSIESSRLAPLIELKRKEERLTTPILLADVVEEAEFNILSTRYLDFKQKENYKDVFAKLHQDLEPPAQFKSYSEGPHVELVNDLAKNIQDGKSAEALKKLDSLFILFRADTAASGGHAGRLFWGDELLKPLMLFSSVMLSLVYFILLARFFNPFKRILRRWIGDEKPSL